MGLCKYVLSFLRSDPVWWVDIVDISLVAIKNSSGTGLNIQGQMFSGFGSCSDKKGVSESMCRILAWELAARLHDQNVDSVSLLMLHLLFYFQGKTSIFSVTSRLSAWWPCNAKVKAAMCNSQKPTILHDIDCIVCIINFIKLLLTRRNKSGYYRDLLVSSWLTMWTLK